MSKFDIVALRRRVCREDYYSFVKTFWGEVIAEDPVWNWHIKIMCREFQKVAERTFRVRRGDGYSRLNKEYDLCFNVPPGSSKSTVLSLLSLPWIWTRDPTIRFLGGSYDKDLSYDFATKARRVIQGDLYRETFPEIVIAHDQDTKGFFANTLKGERRATSTGAKITGRHAHIHVIDDPINPSGVRSEAELHTGNIWMWEERPSRAVSLALTPLILVMQRLSIEDPTGVMLSRKTGIPVKHYCFPAEVSDEVKPAVFKGKYRQGLLDPVRLPKAVLKDQKLNLGAFGYAGQYEQRPVPLTGGMFQTEKLAFKSHPGFNKFFKLIRWWDKAATQDGGKFTAGVLMGFIPGHQYPVWILDVVHVQLNSWARESLIKKTAESDRLLYGPVYKIGLEQEPGSGGVDSTQATIRNLAGFSVIFEKPTGAKMERADPLATYVNAGLVACTIGEWNSAFVQELKYFDEMAKYKDQVDAASAAFKYVTAKKLVAGSAGF